MAAETGAVCPVAETKGDPNKEPTATEPKPQKVNTPKFNTNHEAAIRNTLALALQVTSDSHASRVPAGIPADEAINMAILINSMVRMLNASTVSNKLVVRAAAYMEGEDHLKAGHALRQARFDRRQEVHRQPQPQTTETTSGDDDAPALTGLDLNTSVTTNGSAKKSSNVQQENVKVEAKEQGKQLDSSSQKPKKRGVWQQRRYKPRKSNDAATANHKVAGGVTAVDGPAESKGATESQSCTELKTPTETKAPAVSPDKIKTIELQDTKQVTTEDQDTSNGDAPTLPNANSKSDNEEGDQD